jgi:flavin reductase (DIM6/NTAB) family NADH-FMN oxidoreductase RutF/uncharacterized protein YciI
LYGGVVEFEIRLRRVRPEPFSDEAVARHVDRLADLDDAGRLIAAGPRDDGSGGLILARFDSVADAEDFAATEPFVTGGWETAEVVPWQPATRSNQYLDPGLAGRRAAGDRRFVPLPLDKRDWACSPLPGQIVLVSTVDAGGEVDIAPKSWVSMAAFDPPMIGFGCNTAHRTYANVVASGDFVINVLPADLAPAAWGMLDRHGAERIESSHLTLRPAGTVSAPVVADCVAHLECRYERAAEFGSGEVFVFGRIVAAAIDERCLADDPAVAYRCLNPCFFLQDNHFAALGQPAPARTEPR